MKAALVVPRLTINQEENLSITERMASEASRSGADLVLLPEGVVTGLISNDDPAHDLPLGQPIPGPATERLAALVRQYRSWLGFGLLETEDASLYNLDVLLAPDGSPSLSDTDGTSLNGTVAPQMPASTGRERRPG